MTKEQKAVVESLRTQGLGYKRIAAQTGISANTIKSYLRKLSPVETGSERMSQVPFPPAGLSMGTVCRQCGKPVPQNPGRKEKKFCSDTCRARWWNDHPNLVKRKAVYHFVCPACGTAFSAYGNDHRKYCSRSCYIEDRFGGAR